MKVYIKKIEKEENTRERGKHKRKIINIKYDSFHKRN